MGLLSRSPAGWSGRLVGVPLTLGGKVMPSGGPVRDGNGQKPRPSTWRASPERRMGATSPAGSAGSYQEGGASGPGTLPVATCLLLMGSGLFAVTSVRATAG